MKYRIVFSDVDGTLLNSRHQMLPGTVRAIRTLQGKGIPFVIISGRSPSGIDPILRDNGLHCPMICYSGALMLDETGKTVFSKGFSRDTARNVIGYMEKRGLDCTWNLFSQDTWIVKDRKDPRVALEESIVRARAVEGLPDRLPQDAAVGKILCMCRPEGILDVERELKTVFPGLCIARSSDTLLEIMRGGVCKSSAVREVCAMRQIPLETAVAFGDHYNDADMLETVGMPFLMGNAPEELKSRFPFVTDSNDEEGIDHALRRLGLIA